MSYFDTFSLYTSLQEQLWRGMERWNLKNSNAVMTTLMVLWGGGCRYNPEKNMDRNLCVDTPCPLGMALDLQWGKRGRCSMIPLRVLQRWSYRCDVPRSSSLENASHLTAGKNPDFPVFFYILKAINPGAEEVRSKIKLTNCHIKGSFFFKKKSNKFM